MGGWLKRWAGFNSEISDPRRRLKLWISAMRACYWGIAIRKSQSAFIGDSAPPRSRQNRKVMERFHNSSGTPSKLRSEVSKPQKRKSPASAGLSCKSWRETRDSNPGNAINVRRFSRPLCKITRADVLKAVGVPLFMATDKLQAAFCGGCVLNLGTVFALPRRPAE